MAEDNSKKEGISDAIKKVVSIGIGAAFMTEDAVKSIISDLPLPKDVVTGLVQNAKSIKEDFTHSMRDEFKKYLSKLDAKEVASFLVENYEVDVKASFSFRKKADPPEEK